MHRKWERIISRCEPCYYMVESDRTHAPIWLAALAPLHQQKPIPQALSLCSLLCFTSTSGSSPLAHSSSVPSLALVLLLLAYRALDTGCIIGATWNPTSQRPSNGRRRPNNGPVSRCDCHAENSSNVDGCPAFPRVSA